MKNPDSLSAGTDSSVQEELKVAMLEIFSEAGATMDLWVNQKSRPPALKYMNVDEIRILFRELLNGNPPRLGQMKALMNSLPMTSEQHINVGKLWVRATLRKIGLTPEEMEEEGMNKLEPNTSGTRGMKAEDRKVLNGIRDFNIRIEEEQTKLMLGEDGRLEKYAKNGDTEFLPGSTERRVIIAYRLAHELPLHHENDIKDEHAPGVAPVSRSRNRR